MSAPFMCVLELKEGETGFQPAMNWFTFLKIEVILINQEKFNFISNNMAIMVMASENRLTKYWSEQIHKFTGLEFLIGAPVCVHFTRMLHRATRFYKWVTTSYKHLCYKSQYWMCNLINWHFAKELMNHFKNCLNEKIK